MSTPAPREKSPEPLPEVDASKRYEELVESENTTESSSMKFKNVNDNLYGRNSQPETVSLSQRLSDQYQAARLTAGSKYT